MKLGIIQPGKIGDIVILLPVAKFYRDRGYKIIWPVDRRIIKNFIGYVDYVEFKECSFDCAEARRICQENFCDKVIDVSFTIPNASIENTRHYLESWLAEFDEYKYHLARVPFGEKWNLSIIRNHAKEEELYNKLVKQPEYMVYQFQGSDIRREIAFKKSDDLQAIEIKPETDSIFDWIKILENAKYLVLIDSSVANLVEQLNLPNKKWFIKRSAAQPTLKNEWEIVR